MAVRSISRSFVAAFAAWSCARTGAANARTPKKIVIIVLDAFSRRGSPFAVRRSPFAVRRAFLPETALLAVSFVLVLVAFAGRGSERNPVGDGTDVSADLSS